MTFPPEVIHPEGNGVRYLIKDMPSKQAETCAQRNS